MLASFAFCATIAGIAYVYSENKKKELEEERKKKNEELRKEKTSKGKALIGGPFVLQNTEGEKVTDRTFLGQWLLIYFGFTFCPDICPEELEKIGEIVDLLDKTPEAPKVQPVFISVDPKRDTPELIKSYLLDFHPKFVGLTGTKEQVRRATKAYRVYFSEGPDQAEGANEYIVDHSIVTFLVNPKGEFSANFGQRTSPEEAVNKIVDKMNDFYLDSSS
jgi:protein SCO1/2